MKQSELELDFIRWLGEQYAESVKRQERKYSLLIVRRTMEFNPVQTAYFCRQVASWLPPTEICDFLLGYTTRLWNQFQKDANQ